MLTNQFIKVKKSYLQRLVKIPKESTRELIIHESYFDKINQLMLGFFFSYDLPDFKGVFSKPSNMRTAKNLAQASCTELTLQILLKVQ